MKNRLLIIFTLVFSLNLQAKDSLQKAANKLLDKVRKDLVTLSADFVLYETDANGNKSEDSSGKVWLNSPNKFKWEYIKPDQQLIVSDGDNIWIFDEDLDQVTIKKQKNKQSPIYVLLNKKLTEKNYTASLVPKIEGSKETIDWISLTPKKDSEDVKVVWIGVENNKLTVLKMQNQFDNNVIFNFSNIVRNPKIEEGFFNFIIPKNVDIISDSAEIGEF